MPKFLSKHNATPCYKCTIRLLEDTEALECEFQSNHKGQYLLDYACEQLNLVEKDYFGLRYVDAEKQRHWLDPIKSVLKQIKDVEPVLFSFRVKFYPPNPFTLKEQITRYQIYLQLKRDLLHGRLYCSNDDAALLGAYILQAELGDYNPDEHIGNYASEFKIFLKQTLNIEERMMEIHQIELKGVSLEETEANFLRKACTLDTYGVDPHPVKDQKGNQLYLGVNFNGIQTFQGSRRTNQYRWSEVQKINYEGKMFIVHLVYIEDPRTKKKETVGFKCPTTAACRHIWRCAIEQMLFFTSPSSSNVPRVVSGGGFFSGSKFRYTGRVEREVLEEMAQLLREEPPINRVGSLRRKASSVPATPSTPIVSELSNFQDGGYGNSPRLNYTTFENRLNCNMDQVNLQFNGDGNILEPLAEDAEATSNRFGKKRGFKESYSESALYYNRDPIEHSSSESHITGTASHRSSRSQTPVPKGNVHFSHNMPSDEPIRFVRQHPQIGYTAYKNEKSKSVCSRTCSFFKACLPSLILTILSLLIVMIIAFETNTEFFALLRRAPEMVLIRRQYYEPVKEQVMTVVDQVFRKFRK
ncbi:FERM domain-containing protein 5 isoform X2 [Planococcus citri]|uniref:FERM domain-containing protein 5 isoform X2 n=1 Tax=Planococcus citri TaxID=170843 RepID=UPI0031F72392